MLAAMREFLIVGTGGFIGAVFRYGVSLAFAGSGFPIATLVVNVVGSFAIGLMAGWVESGTLEEAHRQFLAIGLLGALTTFSTFSLETLDLLRAGSYGAAGASVLLNVVLALGAARIGLALAG
jgi:CrcB protein